MEYQFEMNAMKQFLFLAMLLASSHVNAGAWDVISGFVKDSVKPVEYVVETSGSNLRVYEWETPTGKICTSVISSKGIAMDCDWKQK